MWNWLKSLIYKPDAGAVRRQQLEDAERDLASHSSLREYHAAMEQMLTTRVNRLRKEKA